MRSEEDCVHCTKMVPAWIVGDLKGLLLRPSDNQNICPTVICELRTMDLLNDKGEK